MAVVGGILLYLCKLFFRTSSLDYKPQEKALGEYVLLHQALIFFGYDSSLCHRLRSQVPLNESSTLRLSKSSSRDGRVPMMITGAVGKPRDSTLYLDMILVVSEEEDAWWNVAI